MDVVFHWMKGCPGKGKLCVSMVWGKKQREKRKISNQAYSPSRSLQLSNQWKIPWDCSLPVLFLAPSPLHLPSWSLIFLIFMSTALCVCCNIIYVLYHFVHVSSLVILCSLWIFTSDSIGLNYLGVYDDVSQSFTDPDPELIQNSLLSCTPLSLTAYEIAPHGCSTHTSNPVPSPNPLASSSNKLFYHHASCY